MTFTAKLQMKGSGTRARLVLPKNGIGPKTQQVRVNHLDARLRGLVEEEVRRLKGERFGDVPDEDQIKAAAMLVLHGTEVDFEVGNGQIKDVRPVGKEMERLAPPAPVPRPAQHIAPAAQAGPGDFHNPYGFVPAPPRPAAPAWSLGDGLPAPQDRWHDDRVSGRLRVQLTTATPLLLPDPSRARKEGEHTTYPVRVDGSGSPLLAATAVKGMVRAAFEAVTNSRFGVIDRKTPLSHRMEAREGASVVPFRVRAEGSELVLDLLRGAPRAADQRRGGGGGPDALEAAWLPYYGRNPVTYEGGAQPHHGDRVLVDLSFYEGRRNGRVGYRCWRVTRITRSTAEPGSALGAGTRGDGQITGVEGYVYLTGLNARGKHDERVFFSHLKVQSREVEANHRLMWKQTLASYRAEHSDQELGKAPGHNARSWSLHLTSRLGDDGLVDGTMGYAILDGTRIAKLVPVAISRWAWDTDVSSLIDQSLLPPTSGVDLSPAERVFGWVRQGGTDEPGDAAYRGRVRVGPVRCCSDDPIERFFPARALQPLSSPKPRQARFYLAANKNGDPLADGLPRQDVEASTQGIRGRKVYPHHQGWSDGGGGWEVGPGGVRDSQNSSIEGWVKTGTSFEVDVWVEDLSLVELGALVWVLALPDGHYLRIGYGKPLGFGSVDVAIDDGGSELWDHAQQLARLRFEAGGGGEAGPVLMAARSAFEQEVADVYGQPAAGLPFIAAFLQAARGYGDGLPTHYPRTSDQTVGGIEGYRWFGTNDRETRRSLPALVDDPGLPAW